MRTMQQLAQEAIDVQTACNPLGIAKSYAETLSDLRDILVSTGEFGAISFRRHPIARLWASKIHDMAGMGLSEADRYGRAYRACQELAKGNINPVVAES